MTILEESARDVLKVFEECKITQDFEKLEKALAKLNHYLDNPVFPQDWKLVIPGFRKSGENPHPVVEAYDDGHNECRKAVITALENLFHTDPGRPNPKDIINNRSIEDLWAQVTGYELYKAEDEEQPFDLTTEQIHEFARAVAAFGSSKKT